MNGINLAFINVHPVPGWVSDRTLHPVGNHLHWKTANPGHSHGNFYSVCQFQNVNLMNLVSVNF